jgi:hypothetical protein
MSLVKSFLPNLAGGFLVLPFLQPFASQETWPVDEGLEVI